MNFIDYSRIGFEAYLSSSRQEETRNRKKDIITAVFSEHRIAPRSMLFVGFNPAMLEYPGSSVTITLCHDDMQAELKRVSEIEQRLDDLEVLVELAIEMDDEDSADEARRELAALKDEIGRAHV